MERGDQAAVAVAFVEGAGAFAAGFQVGGQTGAVEVFVVVAQQRRTGAGVAHSRSHGEEREVVVRCAVRVVGLETLVQEAEAPGVLAARLDEPAVVVRWFRRSRGSVVDPHRDAGAVRGEVDLAVAQGEIPETVREHYAALTHHASECIGCGACETRCPFGVEIVASMRRAAERFGY